MKRKVNIGVTGLNATDNPGAGVAVIRSIRESPLFEVRIIGLSYENLEPGIYLHDLIDRSYQLPLPGLGHAALFKRLEHIHSIEKLDLIIPNFDSELLNFVRIAGRLKSDLGINTFIPTQDQLELREKLNLNKFAAKCDICVPKTEAVNSASELKNVTSKFEFPIVIKGKFYDASIVYSLEQAVVAFNRIASKWGTPILVQEFIRGTEVNVTAIGDGTGKMVGAVPMRKQYITDKGKAWSGISIEDEDLLKISQRVIQDLKWRGGMELEIVKTDNSEYYLIEINPRFPAWVYLAVGCGQNHPEILVKLALGEHVQAMSDYAVGRLFVRYSMDLIVDLKEFEKISITGEL